MILFVMDEKIESCGFKCRLMTTLKQYNWKPGHANFANISNINIECDDSSAIIRGRICYHTNGDFVVIEFVAEPVAGGVKITQNDWPPAVVNISFNLEVIVKLLMTQIDACMINCDFIVMFN